MSEPYHLFCLPVVLAEVVERKKWLFPSAVLRFRKIRLGFDLRHRLRMLAGSSSGKMRATLRTISR